MTPSHDWWTPAQLAERWQMEPQTLANWRSETIAKNFKKKVGPPWHKFGSNVRYADEDVRAYEQASKADQYNAV
ncbi:hypothetical protein [Salininema proteolyticum]|uniref:Helix-turn-helix domain-containing protein n=1 Tax=Salininema proteolyticum TaxID=1607685 RepID=A0ABV8TZF1_9ACTN